MQINVVTVQGNWILRKIAERIVDNAPDEVDMFLSRTPMANENNLYVDVTNCFYGRTGGVDVGLFTHVHENDRIHIKDRWFTLDHIIHMSSRSRQLFCEDPRFYKYMPAMSVKMPGEIPPGFNYQKPTVGIFQRGKYEGKGYNLILRLIDEPIALDFNWVFAGNDWETPVKRLGGKTNVSSLEDMNLKWPQDYKSLYDKVDIVLIPSKWEGGPMALIEAAALGKTIISSRVGWSGVEIPVDHLFTPGNEKELIAILEKLVRTKKRARRIVEKLSYAEYAAHVVGVFRRPK